jgi:hypothetical protein
MLRSGSSLFVIPFSPLWLLPVGFGSVHGVAEDIQHLTTPAESERNYLDSKKAPADNAGEGFSIFGNYRKNPP